MIPQSCCQDTWLHHSVPQSYATHTPYGLVSMSQQLTLDLLLLFFWTVTSMSWTDNVLEC